jgi:predicted permease
VSEGRVWFRKAMVGLEVALTAVLLIAGGLLMASLVRLLRVDKGFEVAHIVTQDVSFFSAKYAHGVARAAIAEVTEKLQRLPGVEAVGAVSQLPLMGEAFVSTLKDPDVAPRPDEDNGVANFRFVTPDYFKAVGIALRRGRFLEEGDRGRATAVISESAARFLWGDQNPIGRHVLGARRGTTTPTLEVVGIVGEVRGALENAPPMMVYEHFWRMQPFAMSYVLRTRADPAMVVDGIHGVLSSADPEMAIPRARTMEQILDASVASRKFEMVLAVGFAGAALALASLGIYGVISFMVARRTPEMGIRIALGASGAQLAGMVVRQGMIPVWVGLGVGLAGSAVVSRLIANQLYEVRPNDPLYTLGVGVLLIGVGVGACWIPARRAARIDAMTALRFE